MLLLPLKSLPIINRESIYFAHSQQCRNLHPMLRLLPLQQLNSAFTSLLKIFLVGWCIGMINDINAQYQFIALYPEEQALADDTAKKDTFRLYAGLYIPTDTVVPLADTTFTEYGLTADFRGYRVVCPIEVQVSCNGTTEATFDSTLATFDIYIHCDSENLYYNHMIDSMYNEWVQRAQNAHGPLCFTYCSKDNYFLYNQGHFLFYHMPNNNWVNSAILFHYEDHFIKVIYRGQKEEKGWGGLSAFKNQLCYFRGNSMVNMFEPGREPSIHPTDFFIWYDYGKFDIIP